MTREADELSKAVDALLQAVARLQSGPSTDPPSDANSSMDTEAIRKLFQRLQDYRAAGDPSNSAKLSALLGEARNCLQLSVGFLGALKQLPSRPVVVRFDVPDRNGTPIPVTMPLVAAVAMTQDAKRITKALVKLSK